MSFGWCFIYFILDVFYANTSEGYDLKCPEISQRRIRASMVCDNDDTYHCLYDVNENRFQETCETPKVFTSGRKGVYSGNIDARVCSSTQYMPFIYKSNMSYKCLYQRSYCNEEGQKQLHDRSSAEDTACICDFTKGYAFATEPNAILYCIPSEEDCSCYKKSCKDDSYMLSSDYRCYSRTSLPSTGQCQVALNKDPVTPTMVNFFYTGYLEEIVTENKVNLVECKLVAAILVSGLVMYIAAIIYLVIISDIGKCMRDKGIFHVNCPTAKIELFLDAKKLQRTFKQKPRILDICFVNLSSELFVLYIDADNDKIVRYAVGDSKKGKNIIDTDFKEPNRLSKIDERRVAVIHKKKFDIAILDAGEMTIKEKPFPVDSEKLRVKGSQRCIEGLIALSSTKFILSNRELLFLAKANEKGTDGKVLLHDFAKSLKKFDTARRLTCTNIPSKENNTLEKLIFIADENDKMITSIRDNGTIINEVDSHNRGLQNVRSIAATKEFVLAATSAGVSAYRHENGTLKTGYSMLIEYNKHVDHTRGLCIQTIENRIFLALSCVIKRKDVIAIFSFKTSDLGKLKED